MGALSKYWEDNEEIAAERLREMEAKRKNDEHVQQNIKRKAKLPEDKKSGYITVYSRRGEVTLVLNDFLHPKSISLLLENGWHWFKGWKCWVNKYTNENINFAERFLYGAGYDDRDNTDNYVY